MQKLEIQAYSLEEAKVIAFQAGITVVKDATLDWRRSGRPLLTKDLNVYAANFLDKFDMLNFKDAGMIIAVSPGKEDTKKNPFRIQSSRRKGRAKLTRVVEIRTKKDNILIGSAHTKTKALNLAKKLIKERKEDLYGKTIYATLDIDFDMQYAPSVGSRQGQYVVFGVDEADVRISRRKQRGFE